MKLADFILQMEAIAPKELAMDFDNVGLLIGPDHDEIHKVLVALDCTLAVADEAIAWGADIVLTHHPLFFREIKRFLPDLPDTAAAYRLVRHGIGMFAAHTNLDAAQGGVNDCLGAILNIENTKSFGDDGIGRVGDLCGGTPNTLLNFARHVEAVLHTTARFVGDADAPVNCVAVLGGGGGGEIDDAKAAGADTFITGEIKHNQALDAQFIGLNVIEAGHYETEKIVLLPLIERLQQLNDDVQYRLAYSDVAKIRGVNN